MPYDHLFFTIMFSDISVSSAPEQPHMCGVHLVCYMYLQLLHSGVCCNCYKDLLYDGGDFFVDTSLLQDSRKVVHGSLGKLYKGDHLKYNRQSVLSNVIVKSSEVAVIISMHHIIASMTVAQLRDFFCVHKLLMPATEKLLGAVLRKTIHEHICTECCFQTVSIFVHPTISAVNPFQLKKYEFSTLKTITLPATTSDKKFVLIIDSVSSLTETLDSQIFSLVFYSAIKLMSLVRDFYQSLSEKAVAEVPCCSCSELFLKSAYFIVAANYSMIGFFSVRIYDCQVVYYLILFYAKLAMLKTAERKMCMYV